MGPQGFEARLERRNGVAKITVRGELDMATAPILEDHLSRSDGEGTKALVLDLQDLTFMDSSGVRAFLRARDRAKHNDHRFIVVGAGDAVRRVLQITGTEELLDGWDPTAPLERWSGPDGPSDRAGGSSSDG